MTFVKWGLFHLTPEFPMRPEPKSSTQTTTTIYNWLCQLKHCCVIITVTRGFVHEVVHGWDPSAWQAIRANWAVLPSPGGVRGRLGGNALLDGSRACLTLSPSPDYQTPWWAVHHSNWWSSQQIDPTLII